MKQSASIRATQLGSPVLDTVQQELLDLHLKLLASDSKDVVTNVFSDVSKMLPVDWGVFINCTQGETGGLVVDAVQGINVVDQSVYQKSGYLESNLLVRQLHNYSNTIIRLESIEAGENECAQATRQGPAVIGKVSTEHRGKMLTCLFFLSLDRQLDVMESHFLHSLMPCIQTYLLKVKQFDLTPLVTSKEAEVLKWISEGKTNWEIGLILSVSERTAKFHVHNLYKKFKVNSRSLLVARAVRQGCV